MNIEIQYVKGVAQLFEANERVTHYLNKRGHFSLYMEALIGHWRIIDILIQAPFSVDKPIPKCHGIGVILVISN